MQLSFRLFVKNGWINYIPYSEVQLITHQANCEKKMEKQKSIFYCLTHSKWGQCGRLPLSKHDCNVFICEVILNKLLYLFTLELVTVELSDVAIDLDFKQYVLQKAQFLQGAA